MGQRPEFVLAPILFIDKIIVYSIEYFMMKRHIQFYFVLLLFFVSCTLKQNTSLDQYESNTITPISDLNDTEILEGVEPREKVIFKGTMPSPPYYSLITYDGEDHYVETWSLKNMDVILFQDGKEITMDYCHYHNNDILKIYTKCTKDSEYFITSKEYLKLHKIESIQDWLYLSGDNLDDDEHGFIYIYDISEKSFYGDIDDYKTTGDYWRDFWNNLYKTEYEIIKRHQNIKRYGPLLTITHNHKTIEFWKSFCLPFSENKAESYLLLDYYPEYNEIVIRVQYYEGSTNYIFNLESEEYRCFFNLSPYFNRTRTYMISLYHEHGNNSSLQIHAINNGFYKKIKEIKFYDGPDDPIKIINVVWISDTKAQIDFDKFDTMLIEIGEEIKIIYK